MGLDDHSVLEGFSRGEVPKQALTELEAAFGARDIAFDNVIVRDAPASVTERQQERRDTKSDDDRCQGKGLGKRVGKIDGRG